MARVPSSDRTSRTSNGDDDVGDDGGEDAAGGGAAAPTLPLLSMVAVGRLGPGTPPP